MNAVLHGIEVPQTEIERFCERNHVRKLSLFGSILTGCFRPDSDVDVLVEFETDAAVTYLDLARMEQELSTMIGRKVDLRTPQELSRYFRERVLTEAVLQYERK
jgi:predicted nucleotidyltransferase